MPTLAADATAGTYRALFERSPQPVLLVDPESLAVLRANDAACALYGYAREGLAGLPLEKLWPRAREELAPGERSARHLRADGAPLEVSLGVLALAPMLALFVTDNGQALSVALLEAHNRVLDLISRGSPLAQVLEELVLSMERLSSGMMGSLLLLDEDGRRMRHGAAPSLPQAYWRAVDGLEIGRRVGSCGTAMFLVPVEVALRGLRHGDGVGNDAGVVLCLLRQLPGLVLGLEEGEYVGRIGVLIVVSGSKGA